MNHHDEFDDLLHDALGEYREAEPLAGIESRILARIQERDSRRRAYGWRWAIAFACAAAVALAIWFSTVRRVPQPSAPPVVASESPYPGPDLPVPDKACGNSPGTPQEVRQSAQTTTPPVTRRQAVVETRPAVFPLPTRLSPEERAFMAAMQKAPDSGRVAPEQDKEITIAEIEIKPLVIGGASSSENPGEKQ